MHFWLFLTTLLLFICSVDMRANNANRGSSPSRSSSSSSLSSHGSRGSSGSRSHSGLSGSRSQGSLIGSRSSSNNHYGTYPGGSSSSNGHRGFPSSQSSGNMNNWNNGNTHNKNSGSGFSSFLGGSHRNGNNHNSGTSLGGNTGASNHNYGNNNGGHSGSSKSSGGLGSLMRSNKFKAAIAGAASSYMAHRAGKKMIRNAYSPMMYGGRSYYWGPSYYVPIRNYQMCSAIVSTTDSTFGNVFFQDMTRPKQIVWSCMLTEMCCGFECCPAMRPTSSIVGWIKDLFG
uniref:CX domain-containing protein n=1 Tax=Plectus sambesii TaxID=2011161 RepID=A0A914VJS1_9BILA